MNGFLLIDKEEDWSSRDVCNKVRSVLHTKKVGHTGTLDPFATGLLLVSIGNGTKAGTFLEEFDKEYEATLVLGSKTTTGDRNGGLLLEQMILPIERKRIEKVFKSMIGKQKQIPPMTSAIHYNGTKLYTLAHRGIEVEREPRDIEVFSLELIKVEGLKITFRCHVSKGTYIRVLGETIAEKLETIGFLESLRRIAVGPYRIEEAIKLEDVDESKVLPIADILSKNLYTWTVDEASEKRIYDGASMKIDNIPSECDKILVVDNKRNALAVYRRQENDTFVCLRGLW